MARHLKWVLLLCLIASDGWAVIIRVNNVSGGTAHFILKDDGVVQFHASLANGAMNSYGNSFLQNSSIDVLYSVTSDCSSPYTCMIYQAVWGSPGGPNTPFTSDTSGTWDVYLIAPGSTPTTNMCSLTICVRNNDSRYRVYGLFKAGVQYTMASYPGGMGVGAGQSACYSFQDYCTNSTGWYLDLYPGEYGQSNPATNYSVVTNGSPVYPSATNSYTPNGPAQFNPTNGWGSSNIIWTGTAQTNVIISQQQGDQALYDAITKAAANADEKLRGITNGLGVLTGVSTSGFNGGSNVMVTGFNGSSNVLVRGFNGLSNSFSGLSNVLGSLTGLTNGTGGETGVVAAVNSFHTDNTNLLGQILERMNVITNEPGTNVFDAEAASDEMREALQGVADGLPGGYEIGDTPLGSEWQISIPLGPSTVEIDLNPFNKPWVADLAALVRRIVAWSLLAGLIFLNTKFTMDSINAAGSFRQATTAGTTIAGFNVNSPLAVAMAVAITVALGAIPSFFVAWITGDLSIASESGLGSSPVSILGASPFSSVTTTTIAQSLYMANRFLPLLLFFTVTINHFVYRVSMGALLWVAQTAVRFLVG